ncbi:MAG: hypothetical protein NZT61_06650 [Deltaproteobacteria bacterium]|nr:hypothetical protein [Deltaproteobacteria bacterium]
MPEFKIGLKPSYWLFNLAVHGLLKFCRDNQFRFKFIGDEVEVNLPSVEGYSDGNPRLNSPSATGITGLPLLAERYLIFVAKFKSQTTLAEEQESEIRKVNRYIFSNIGLLKNFLSFRANWKEKWFDYLLKVETYSKRFSQDRKTLSTEHSGTNGENYYLDGNKKNSSVKASCFLCGASVTDETFETFGAKSKFNMMHNSFLGGSPNEFPNGNWGCCAFSGSVICPICSLVLLFQELGFVYLGIGSPQRNNLGIFLDSGHFQTNFKINLLIEEGLVTRIASAQSLKTATGNFSIPVNEFVEIFLRCLSIVNKKLDCVIWDNNRKTWVSFNFNPDKLQRIFFPSFGTALVRSLEILNLKNKSLRNLILEIIKLANSSVWNLVNEKLYLTLRSGAVSSKDTTQTINSLRSFEGFYNLWRLLN